MSKPCQIGLRYSLYHFSGSFKYFGVLELLGQGPWAGGPGTSLLLPCPAALCLLFSHLGIAGCCWLKPPDGNRATFWGRKGNYGACELCCESRSNREVLLRRWRKAVPYRYLLMQIESFVFSNVHFAFSLIIFSEFPYVLLVIFQSCQIKKRKPYN